MSAFVSARGGPKGPVIYKDSDGNEFKYEGGTRPWRNNNPGNIAPGKISHRHNQIGVAGGFAIFPDYQTGHEALIDSLKTTFANSTIESLVKAYVQKPKSSIPGYIRELRRKTGVLDQKKVKDFSPKEFENLWKGVEQMEGATVPPGKIIPIPKKKKITAVRKDKKGTIVAYFVKEFGWLSKSEAIRLVSQGKIDAVVAHSSAGTPYIRTRPDGTVDNNLDVMG